MGTRWMVLLWLPLPLNTRNGRRGSPFGEVIGRKVNEWRRTSSPLSPASLPLRLPVLQLSASPLASTSWLSRDCAICYIFITGTIDGKSHFIMWKMQCSWLSKFHSAVKNLCEALFYISCILCIGWNEKIMKGCILSTFASVWLAALTDLFFKCIYFLHWALLFSTLSR